MMNRDPLTIFSFEYPPIGGGISRLCGEIVAGYARAGLNIGVLTQEKVGDIPMISGTSEHQVISRRPWREWSAFIELRKSNYAAPVIASIWYPEGLLTLLAGRRPCVILALGLELLPVRSAWRRPLWRWLQRKVLESADLVVAISQYTQALVESTAPASRVCSIPLAVDHQRFSPGNRQVARQKFQVQGKRVLCSVSRLSAYKGHETVLQALAALPAAMLQNFVYLIAGTGSYKPALERRVQTLGLTNVVRWLEYVPESELPDLYRATDLFVLCTRESQEEQVVEGFGLVFLEAQACGTPVIGTKTGGIPDAIRHERGGWLIEQDDVAVLAQHIIRLAEAPESFESAGRIARQRVETECTWDQYITKFTEALRGAGIELGGTSG